MIEKARIPEFYKFPVHERLRVLYERNLLNEEDYHTLMGSKQVLATGEADKLSENVIGVFSMPLGLGLNFLINNKDYIVPLVVEEPSILAALSSAAKVVRKAKGFTVTSTNPILIGQIQIINVKHSVQIKNKIESRTKEILDIANSLHPNMFMRGGGAKGLEVVIHPSVNEKSDMVVIHLLVNTCDAMGANLVNTMCEGVSPFIEKITGNKVFLRILSNYTDRSMVKAQVVIPTKYLTMKEHSGEKVRDAIILAADFAMTDPYRATTHNKGIMNGIDAVALATGNDWRAIEAAAHAYAGRGHSYTSLTKWFKNDEDDLVGVIELPLKVGIVGGPMQSNPAVSINQRILNVKTARELAEVMGAVGLAQNFSALKALGTEGIQRGHMTLHARSVAVAAGAMPHVFDELVEKLVESNEIKVWKAKEILEKIDKKPDDVSFKDVMQFKAKKSFACGHGKIILLGEHSAVYGKHVIAAPIPLAVQARVKTLKKGGIQIFIPRFGIEETLIQKQAPRNSLEESISLIVQNLGVSEKSMKIDIISHIPRAMSLGGSAAIAVAVIRAISQAYHLDLSDKDVNKLAFECEKISHITPSGVDNTLATYGRFVCYKKGQFLDKVPLNISKPIPIVIGISGIESLTSKMVMKVKNSWQKNPSLFDNIFSQMDDLTIQAIEMINSFDLEGLGELMNVFQGLLNAIGVSTFELEELIQIARENGAMGAKITGSGGGGSIIALCEPDDKKSLESIAQNIRKAGYRAIITEIS